MDTEGDILHNGQGQRRSKRRGDTYRLPELCLLSLRVPFEINDALSQSLALRRHLHAHAIASGRNVFHHNNSKKKDVLMHLVAVVRIMLDTWLSCAFSSRRSRTCARGSMCVMHPPTINHAWQAAYKAHEPLTLCIAQRTPVRSWH